MNLKRYIRAQNSSDIFRFLLWKGFDRKTLRVTKDNLVALAIKYAQEQLKTEDLEDVDTKREDWFANQEFLLWNTSEGWRVKSTSGAKRSPVTGGKRLQDAIRAELELIGLKRPVINEIKVNGYKPTTIPGRVHKNLSHVLNLAQVEKNIYLVGAAGTGKTTLAKQAAESMGLNFAQVSCTEGMSETKLIGYNNLESQYMEPDLVSIYEKGGVFLFDEVDASDSNTMLIMNSAIANGILSVPARRKKTHAVRHKDTVIICAANTYGNGSFDYVGRNQMDAAFMDRFSCSKVLIEYDQDLEREILPNEFYLNKLWSIRERIFEVKIRKVMSTRTVASVSRQMSAGTTYNQIMEAYTLGWTSEEIEKIGKEKFKS